MNAFERPGPLVGGAALALLVLIWGTTWAAIRVGLDGIPPLTGVAARFGIAAAILLGAGLAAGVRFGGSARERRLWIVNGLLSYAVSYGIVYWAEQWVPSGLAAVLFATFTLIVAVLAHFFLPGERLGAAAWAGLAIGFAGVAVIFSEDLTALGGPGVPLAASVLLVSPLASAIASVAIKRWGRDIHPLSISAVPMAIGAAVMAVLAGALERGQEIRLDPLPVAALLYLAIFGSAVTFSLYFWLLLHMPASRLALIAYATPVVAVAIGALFLDEPVTLRTASGTALVIAGIALATRRPRPKGRGYRSRRRTA